VGPAKLLELFGSKARVLLAQFVQGVSGLQGQQGKDDYGSRKQ
jgi:hypothetical protein